MKIAVESLGDPAAAIALLILICGFAPIGPQQSPAGSSHCDCRAGL